MALAGSDDGALFRLLVESVRGYAIFMLDPQGVVVTWNAGAHRIKGYAPDEIIGRHFSTFYPEAERRRCAEALEVAARDGRFEDEGYRIRNDGTQFWANVIITAVRGDAGELIGFAKVTQDLTPRLRMEHEQVRLARAEEAERRKDEFLAIMGHELRNPLAPMVTAVHLIKMRGGGKFTKEVAVLDRQLKHMIRLVDDLLDVSRLLRDEVRLDRRVVELSSVIAQAAEVARPHMMRKRQDLAVSVATSGLPVHVDADRMVQVFGNLLTNAAKFTPEDGHIRVTATLDEPMVVVTVDDDGVGISAELLPRLFDLFTQGEQSVDRKQGGLGIGLAVARRLVDGHGGQVTAESAGEGRGSRFTVRLPRAQLAPAYEKSPTPALGFALPRRVLVVDDEEDTGEMMRAALTARGHQVELAYSGARALELAVSLRPHVVFLDIGLPDIDGFEVASRLRSLPGVASVPLIAVSGYARPADRQRALDAGFADHLSKPVRTERLIRAVESTPLS